MKHITKLMYEEQGSKGKRTKHRYYDSPIKQEKQYNMRTNDREKMVAITINNGGKDGKSLEKIIAPSWWHKLWGEVSRQVVVN